MLDMTLINMTKHDDYSTVYKYAHVSHRALIRHRPVIGNVRRLLAWPILP